MIPIPAVVAVSTVSTARHALTLAIAALPALVTWWNDRRLLDKADDPALPELLATRQRTSIRVIAVAIAFMIVFAGAAAAWGIPLLAALLVAAGYPLRTRVLGETWGFGAYLWHTTLSVIGGFGFWIALAYAPSLTGAILRATGLTPWWLPLGAALVVAVPLGFWEYWYPQLWLRAHAARPLDRAALIPRFAAIVERAGTVHPAVYSVGPKGSRFVNAVALPSARRPAVAMGDTLLDLLDADESTAIFAHEIAHFDHLSPRYIRRSQMINRALIAVGVGLPILTTAVAPAAGPWVSIVWPIVVILALGRRAAKSQQHETECDLRAAALCGDPEALVRALAKVHLHARVPRRWDMELERVATHPSLVRRIQAIRGLAGTAPDAGAAGERLGGTTIVRSPRAGSWVVFDDVRAHWLDGIPPDLAASAAADAPVLDLTTLRDAASSYRAVNYQDLAELRVAAVGDARTLHARTRGGDAWTVPVAIADVTRVQRTLDVVDVRLGRSTKRGASSGIARFVAIMTPLVGLIAGHVTAVLAPAALVLWKPGPASLAALGTASLASAAVGAIEQDSAFTPGVAHLMWIVLAVAGAVALVAAVRDNRAAAGEPSPHWRFTVLSLGIVAAVGVLLVAWQAFGGDPDAALPSFAPATLRWLGMTLAALAAALLTQQARRTRAVGLATLTVGVATVSLGIDRSALALRGALAESSGTATRVSESSVGSAATGLRVSPNGERFVVSRLSMTRRPVGHPPVTLLAGRIGGPAHELSGLAAEFVDDERLLVLSAAGDGVELRLESADSGAAPSWVDTLTSVTADEARLGIDRDAGNWTVIATAPDSDVTVLVSGRIDQRGTTRRIALPDTLPVFGDPVMFGESLVTPLYRNVMPGTASLLAMAFLGAEPFRTELWRVDTGGMRRIATLRGMPQCGEPLGGVAACVVRSRNGVSLYTLAETGIVTEVARASATEAATWAVGPGPRAATMTFNRELLIADLASRRLTRIPPPPGSEYASEVRAGPGYVVTLSHTENRASHVRRYATGP